MARCPHLEYHSRGFISGEYRCKLCNKNLSETEVKHKCNSDYGDEYKKCPIYKD